MPLTCGVNINLNNFQSQIDTQISAILNLDLGTPSGLSALSASINGALSTVTSQLSTLIPTIPVLGSLRGALNELSELAFGSTAAVGKILSIVSEYAGILGLQGYVGLNLTDHANYVFALGINFDPCSADFPNVFRDSTTGLLQQLPDTAPLIGQSLQISNLEETLVPLTDNFTTSLQNNIDFDQLDTTFSVAAAQMAGASDQIVATAQTTIAQAEKALNENVQTAITGMGNVIRQMPTGEEIVELESAFIERLDTEVIPFIKEIPKDMASRDLPAMFLSTPPTTGFTSQSSLAQLAL